MRPRVGYHPACPIGLIRLNGLNGLIGLIRLNGLNGLIGLRLRFLHGLNGLIRRRPLLA
jgi:hypothetical protein